MKKKLIITAMVVSMVAALSGCLSKEQKEEAKRYEKQAEKNAVEYIKEKYDIDAKVISSEFNKTGEFGEKVSTYVDVEMEYEDEKFDVYILGNEAWKDAKESRKEYTFDNYQYDEIYKDLKAYLEKETKVNIEEILIKYSCEEVTELEHITNQYYEGNLEAFLEDQYVNVVLVTTDKALGEFGTVDMGDGSMYVYSYEEEYYKKYGHTLEYDNEEPCALWMNWSANVISDEEEVTEYEKQEFGLGYLVYKKGCNENVSDTSADEKNWENSGFDGVKTVSDAYKICGDKEDIYIYVKSDDDDESVGIAYKKNDKMKYEKLITHHEKYMYGKLNMKKYDGEVSVVILED